MKKLTRIIAKLWSQKNAGYTIMELLSVIMISSIIGGAIMTSMTQLWRSDETEIILTQTDGEMQSALEYLTKDLKEAVFVYEDTTQLFDPAKKYIPTGSQLGLDTNTKPIFAFWTAKIIPDEDLPSTCASDNIECNNLLVRRMAYSLVVYYQEPYTMNKNGQTYQKSRLHRYELPKYSDSKTLTKSNGFVDPGEENNFLIWPLNGNGSVNLQTIEPATTGKSAAMLLVDYVDNPAKTNVVNLPNCPDENYNRLPSDAATNNSFFICVRKTGEEVGKKQDIFLYLRGNPVGRGGIVKEEEIIAMPTLKTQVTLRGIIDKK